MKKRQFAIWLPTLGACFLLLLVFVRLLGSEGVETQVTASGNHAYKTFLLAGVDDAGENTDMLMLCSLNKQDGSTRFLQIPRDTFYRTDNGEGKINRIYRACVSKYGKKHAAEEFSKEMEKALSIPIDGYVVFHLSEVKEMVSLVGGVPVNVPYDIPYLDTKTGEERIIPAGERILNGEESVAFVRHRKSYAEGDLGRLDAQLRFLSGLSTVLPSLKKVDSIILICQKIIPNLLTNLKEKDIIEVMMAHFKKSGSHSVSFMRLPGEACYTSGVWYYVLYRNATEEMLRREMGLSATFDPKHRFTDENVESLSNVYFTEDRFYRVYTPEEVKNKRILHS